MEIMAAKSSRPIGKSNSFETVNRPARKKKAARKKRTVKKATKRKAKKKTRIVPGELPCRITMMSLNPRFLAYVLAIPIVGGLNFIAIDSMMKCESLPFRGPKGLFIASYVLSIVELAAVLMVWHGIKSLLRRPEKRDG